MISRDLIPVFKEIMTMGEALHKATLTNVTIHKLERMAELFETLRRDMLCIRNHLYWMCQGLSDEEKNSYDLAKLIARDSRE